MSKRRMVGWHPLAVENHDPSHDLQPPTEPESPVEPVEPAEPATDQGSEPAAAPAPETPVATPSQPVQDSSVQRRRMTGWKPLTVANTAAPAAAVPATAEPAASLDDQPHSAPVEAEAVEDQPMAAEPAASSGPVQDPDIPRRRMAGWTPLKAPTTQDAQPAPVAAAGPAAPDKTAETAAAPTETAAAQSEEPSAAAAALPPPPATDDLPRRRMDGWQPLQVGHPNAVAEQTSAAAPAPEPAAPEPTAEPAPKRRMGAPAAETARSDTSTPETSVPQTSEAPEEDPEVKTPDVVTPPPAEQPAATETVEKDVAKEPSKVRKVLVTLGIVAVVAVVGVLLAQWLRTLDPVASFITTYDGTPTHPDAVQEGIPGWVGWQHFFNFFIIVMVIRSGFIIRNQERPEAYWTPNQGGFYSPKKNSPQKVSIQQWIHQSFNVLWVVNGLIFFIMIFATGHWMRLVPTNWDIFPNIVSAGLQYVSLDWPEEQSWVYYNALQLITYFITVFIAAPIAIISGLRLSTWWPQQAKGLNKAFPLEVARKVHFFTMLYFILFIIVHIFLVFTTGVLSNLNMMFTARHADDWIGIGVFALSVVVTVGIAWLIKPIFISPIAEKTGQVSTR